jgi:hypothetical protein
MVKVASRQMHINAVAAVCALDFGGHKELLSFVPAVPHFFSI